MEKIKKSMRREDGFTLVELLAVIVILGIILAIAIPAVGNVITNAETKASERTDALILDAARLYFIGEEGAKSPVTVGQLVTLGYLDERDGVDLSESTREVIQLENGTLEFGTP